MSEDVVILAQDVLKASLTQISKTVDGTGFAFVRLNCSGKNITTVPSMLEEFKHLLYIDFSNNQIKDFAPFCKLPHVLFLMGSQNHLVNMAALKDPCLPFCQTIDLSNNKIEKLGAVKTERLQRLMLNGNQISGVEDFDGHPSLEILSLRQNKLKNCEKIAAMPKLRELILAENEIDNVSQLADMNELQTLDLSNNKLEKLDGFKGVANINTLVLKSNLVQDLREFEKLRVLPKLRKLTTEGNPADNGESFRTEIIILLDRLTHINDQPVTAEEKQAAKELFLAREKEKEEAAKKAAEEAAAAEKAKEGAPAE